MPPYYFHLAFELFPDHQDPLSAPSRESASAFVPPPGFDLFSAPLPVHSSSSWASYLAPRKAFRRTQSGRAPGKDDNASHLRKAIWPGYHTTEDIAKPKHTHSALKQQVDQDSYRYGKSKLETEIAGDWRFDRVAVDCIDFKSRDAMSHGSAPQEARTGSSSVALWGSYVPSDPTTTELGSGIIHLYRDLEPARELESAVDSAVNVEAKTPKPGRDEEAYVDKDGTTLCILAVPSYMTPSDLLGWLTEQTLEQISHLRLIRTARSNRFMALIKFKESKGAKSWQKEWNGKLFNSMEPENCHVVFVKSIRFQARAPGQDSQSFPDMTNDPFTPALKQTASPAERKQASLTSNKPAPPPTPSLIELPTCPVCLERMDETNGLATIFCQHVFHCACLQKWKGSGCPVCRYTQNDPLARLKSDDDENECAVCGSQANLWICLICGHVGCGRYDEAHAFAHYEQTSHTFAMDVATQHIWDYDGDEYVHRLIQNKADGKLVELPAAGPNAQPGSDMIPRDKMENMSLEYTYLLTSQLDSQRLYYETQMDRAVDKAAKSAVAAEQASQAVQKTSNQLEQLEASFKSEQERFGSMEREKDRAEKRAEKFETMARKMEKEWREEKVVNESLLDRIKHLEKQVEEATVRSSDLEEQNRDLSFFISGMEKLKGAGEDVQEGTLEVGAAPGSKKKGKKKR